MKICWKKVCNHRNTEKLYWFVRLCWEKFFSGNKSDPEFPRIKEEKQQRLMHSQFSLYPLYKICVAWLGNSNNKTWRLFWERLVHYFGLIELMYSENSIILTSIFLTIYFIKDTRWPVYTFWVINFYISHSKFERENVSYRKKVLNNGYPENLVDNVRRMKTFRLIVNEISAFRNENPGNKLKLFPYSHYTKQIQGLWYWDGIGEQTLEHLLGNPRDKSESIKKSGSYEMRCQH